MGSQGKEGDKRHPNDIPDNERDYYLERVYPSFGNLAPRDVASRQAKYRCDEGKGVNESGLAVYLDFSDSINRLGEKKISEKYGNLFQMYEKITGRQPIQNANENLPSGSLHYGWIVGGL